ncbi:MAG: Gfo/Idh/MocA family oxidoreductase [Candidatus Latescibacterota bacterium]|nr:Gfo/Idh/MocA family oxidoreductase [Candidatus Latescibacterota bacterium]
MSKTTRWGIIGTGSIAKSFARGLKDTPKAELIAVGSRNQENADKFGDMFSVPVKCPSYQELADFADIDAIYISTPHPFHKENTIMCLQAGKPVLCEKPFAINSQEAAIMVQTARDNGVFLMEAMWSRYLPVMQHVRKWLDDGTIGEVRWVSADFGFRANMNPQSRLFNRELGGGALLDVGIYVTSFASFVLGPRPNRIQTLANMGNTGVDEQNTLLLGYNNGAMAVLTSSLRTTTPHEARIVGTEGNISIQPPFYKAEKATLTIGDHVEEIELNINGNGYNYEAIEVGHCLNKGLLESSVMPLDETVAIMKILDEARAQWGFTYPTE